LEAAITTQSDDYSHFFEVKLELFDGPIDLLLHLVKQRELPIEKVSLADVTGQYLACVQHARKLDLEVAGEYLVIAATLLSIKSSLLLNEPVPLIEDEEGNFTNPHDELLRKLREHEIYKHGAFMLSCRKVLGVDVFLPPSTLAEVEPPPVQYKQHDPMLLGLAFKKLIERLPAASELKISFDAISIVDRMMSVLDILKRERGAVPFHRLVPDLTSRGALIGSFCALLELCKRHAIRIHQNDVLQEIFVALTEDTVDLTGVTSEFDTPSGEAEQKIAQAH
jgi:segregation and condensation protein A